MSKTEPTLEDWREAYLELRRAVEGLKDSRMMRVTDMARERKSVEARLIRSKKANPELSKEERIAAAERHLAKSAEPKMLDWAALQYRVSDALGVFFAHKLQELFRVLRDTDERIHRD